MAGYCLPIHEIPPCLSRCLFNPSMKMHASHPPTRPPAHLLSTSKRFPGSAVSTVSQPMAQLKAE